MSQSDKTHALYIYLKKVVGKNDSVVPKDLHKLVEMAERNGYNPESQEAGLFSYFLLAFDKEVCIQIAKDKSKALCAIAKALTSLTIGLMAGINYPVKNAVADVLLKCVDLNVLETKVAVMILGQEDQMRYTVSLISEAMTNISTSPAVPKSKPADDLNSKEYLILGEHMSALVGSTYTVTNRDAPAIQRVLNRSHLTAGTVEASAMIYLTGVCDSIVIGHMGSLREELIAQIVGVPYCVYIKKRQGDERPLNTIFEETIMFAYQAGNDPAMIQRYLRNPPHQQTWCAHIQRILDLLK